MTGLIWACAAHAQPVQLLNEPVAIAPGFDAHMLIVNVAPFGCMPGTITSALCREVQSQTGVPIVSLFYDGEPGMNQRLEVFLAGLADRGAHRTDISARVSDTASSTG